jgi:ribosome-binding protein aMBF1 (putative translation factor)
MADVNETVATNFRRLRNACGWSQEDLAPDRVGLNARYLAQIERAEASMGVSVLGDRI